MSEYLNYLEPYMLTCKNISKFTRYIETSKSLPKKKEFKLEKNANSIFIPYQNDKLFWIFYYISKGYVEYNMVGSKSYSIEIEEKIKLVDVIKSNKVIFKEYKLNKINDNINELLSTSEISFKTFEILCIIFKLSFVIIKDNMYHKILFDDTSDVYIIHIVNNIYGCERINVNELSNYETNRYEIKNYDKPITSVASFKVDELMKVAEMLGISSKDESDKKLNKQELYLLVATKVNNFF
jgi:hypothetical protein